jgi:hypothetical protein
LRPVWAKKKKKGVLRPNFKEQAGSGGIACNPSTQEAEAGRTRVPVQPGLHSKTLTQKNNKKIYFHQALVAIPIIVATSEA